MFKKLLIISTFSIGILTTSMLPPETTLAADEVVEHNGIEQVNANRQLGEFITLLTSTLQQQSEENQKLILQELALNLESVLDEDGQIKLENVTTAQIENISEESEKYTFEIPDNKELSKVYQYDESTKEYRQLTHEEAMAYNPLHHVNTKRDELILDAIQKEKSWSSRCLDRI